MPDLLGPTNPVQTYDKAPVQITSTPASDTSVQNIVNPEQVVRPDRRTDQQDTGGDAALTARYDSNFMTFVQRLRNAPDLGETFLQILQDVGLQVSSGISDGFAAEMSQFLEFLQMDEGQLMSFLQNQVQSGSRFSGPIFQTLRNAYAGTQSELAKTDILQFLRRFSDYSSTDHIEGKLTRTLSEMSQSLPSQWSDRVTELLAQLKNGISAGDRDGNLRLLREQLFPMMARYVSMTHDHGRARALLSTLTLDIARYENGSERGMLTAMRQLSANNVLPEELNDLSDQELLQLLKGSSFFRASQSNAFADRLADATDRALHGEGGVHSQEAFRNILSSILINESVYMPLNHIMVPIQWDDRLMFSEMWVDPDAERGSSSGEEDRTLRLLIKMDVQSLGAFDLIINARNNDVSLHLSCPEQVARFSREITDSLSEILHHNGLQSNTVRVGPMKRPVAISEVFPKLFERVSGVNVKI